MRIAILFFLVMPTLAFGHGGGSEGPASVGPGKGVEWYDDHEGFVLAKEAIKRMGVQMQDAGPVANCSLKPAELVAALGEKVIYIQRDNKFLSVKPVCSSLKAGDRLVTKGAAFLRVVELDLKAGDEGEEEEAGHDGDHDEHEGHSDEHKEGSEVKGGEHHD